eukprot:g44316.t1
MKQNKIVDKSTSFLDALNAFYAWFEQNGSGMVSPVLTAPDVPVPSVTAEDVRVFLAEVERVNSIKFLGMTITNNPSWTSHVDVTIKKAQQCLFFLRRLRKFSMSIKTLTNLYRCTIESILSRYKMA